MDDVMIKVDKVSKQYRLGQISGTTLREELQRAGARLHHREDPTRRIDAREPSGNGCFVALDEVSFEVKTGERVGLIGHNGAGKSTLLKLISRITAPTSGTIGLNGRVASMLEVGTGFHGELTGRENIYMNGAILGMTKREIDEKLEDIIEFSECRQFIDTPVKRYSSGMYVKLAFSVAAHLNSEIMIMDEVLAVGDMAFQKKSLDKMSDVSREEGRTILYVSHNMNTIRQLCDRVIVLDHGRVSFDGGVDEGIERYLGDAVPEEYPCFHELREFRRYWERGREILMESLRFVDCESAEFAVGQPICFELGLSSRVSRDQVRCLLRVRDKNNVTRIAGCLSEPFTVEAAEGQTLRFSLTLTGLEPGRYSLNPELLQYNSSGNFHCYDEAEAMIPIRITARENSGEVWPAKYWGSIRLSDMRLTDRTDGAYE